MVKLIQMYLLWKAIVFVNKCINRRSNLLEFTILLKKLWYLLTYKTILVEYRRSELLEFIIMCQKLSCLIKYTTMFIINKRSNLLDFTWSFALRFRLEGTAFELLQLQDWVWKK